MKPRIAITGVGAVTALGNSAEEAFERLIAGEIAVRQHELPSWPELEHLRTAACELPLGYADLPRVEALSMAAIDQALRDSGVEPQAHPAAVRTALAWGTTTGGLREAEDLLGLVTQDTSPEQLRPLLGFPISATACRAGERFGPFVRTRTLCSACSSGALAVVVGASWLELGVCDRVVVGGADALCATTLLGFSALGLLDPLGGRPFDRGRGGLSLGEGAGALVLETAELALRRGARIRAWLAGWAAGSEAFHITQPEPHGTTAAGLMRRALARGSASPEEVGYVNAHGTGTLRNDAAELAALRALFGEDFARPRVSSNKGQIGHCLGAAGAVEAVFCVLSVERGELPPNATPELEACRGLIGTQAVRSPVGVALSNSFGFGGMGSVLCFSHHGGGRAQPDSGAASFARLEPVSDPRGVEGSAVPKRVYLARHCLLEPLPGSDPRQVPPRGELIAAERSRRFDDMSVLVAAAVERVLSQHGDVSRLEATALLHGTAFGAVQRAAHFLARARSAGPSRVPPADFPSLLPSAASGNAAIYAGVRGPVGAVSDFAASAHSAVHQAVELVLAGEVHQAISCCGEPLDPLARRAGAAWFGLPDPQSWAAAAQLWSCEPSAIWVASFGESRGPLPALPQGNVAAFLGSSDRSVALDWGGFGLPTQAGAARPSVEGLGGAAVCLAAAELERRELAHALVVDISKGRVLHTLLSRVEHAG